MLSGLDLLAYIVLVIMGFLAYNDSEASHREADSKISRLKASSYTAILASLGSIIYNLLRNVGNPTVTRSLSFNGL